MITATLRVRLPEGMWISEVSQSFPAATFRLLTGIRTGETAVELGELVADEPLAVAKAVASHPSIVTYRRLELTDGRSLAKYETTDTELYAFVEGASLPPEFPIVVENGRYEFEFTGTREDLDRLRSGLEAADVSYELRSLVEAAEPAELLTRRQREVLEAAVREGYFEVPRECTLAELATTVGVDKSTASEIVRRAEGRIVKRFLTGIRGERLGESDLTH